MRGRTGKEHGRREGTVSAAHTFASCAKTHTIVVVGQREACREANDTKSSSPFTLLPGQIYPYTNTKLFGRKTRLQKHRGYTLLLKAHLQRGTFV